MMIIIADALNAFILINFHFKTCLTFQFFCGFADVIARNLTTASNGCEAAPRSFFWAPNRFNELTERRFEFPFILIGKSSTAFLTGQSWRVLGTHVRAPKQGYWCCFCRRSNVDIFQIHKCFPLIC